MDNGYTLFNDTYVMYQLLEFINESSIICLCKTSKKLNEICEQYIEMEDDKRFEVNITKRIGDNSELLEEYCINNDIIKLRKISKIDLKLLWDDGLYLASKNGNIDIANFIAEKETYLEWGLQGACQSGDIDIVNLMIEKGANDWNDGLYFACRGGHIDIVNLMIEKGADNWDWGLQAACGHGHIDIVRFMIEKGANYCEFCGKSMEEHLKK